MYHHYQEICIFLKVFFFFPLLFHICPVKSSKGLKDNIYHLSGCWLGAPGRAQEGLAFSACLTTPARSRVAGDAGAASALSTEHLPGDVDMPRPGYRPCSVGTMARQGRAIGIWRRAPLWPLWGRV